MQFELTSEQLEAKARFREFVDKEIIPYADEFDSHTQIPGEIFQKLAQEGYLGAIIPTEYGGMDLDMITLAIMHEEFGRGYGSVQNILTVYGMVSRALVRWGNAEQKAKWLPRIAKGETIVAVAITEPSVGSDVKAIETSARHDGDRYILDGEKKWITLGQVADLFLVCTKFEGRRGATFLIERDTPGFSVEPITGMLGLKANMLGQLQMKECQVPGENLVGRIGMGITHVASYALDEGRYTTACGCVGLGQACLEQSLMYSGDRKQFGVYLKEHQLIQKMITEIAVQVKAARQLCYRAGYLRNIGDPSSITETLMAKYFASKMVNTAANHAVQIQGAAGCNNASPVERYYRDAKLMEIIEGASQMYEIQIAKNLFLF